MMFVQLSLHVQRRSQSVCIEVHAGTIQSAHL